MSLLGTGFFCFWAQAGNGLEDDFDLWHTREHMVERMKVPGVLAARRYSSTEPDQPNAFIAYDLAATCDFEGQAWKNGVSHASPWTEFYRQPGNFASLRCGCFNAVSVGGGMGGAIATTVIKVPKEVTHPWIVGRDYLPTLLDHAPVVGVHMGVEDGSVKKRGSSRFDPEQPPMGAPEDPTSHCVLILDTFSKKLLKPELGRIGKGIQDKFKLAQAPVWRTYDFCYYLDQTEARKTVEFPRPGTNFR